MSYNSYETKSKYGRLIPHPTIVVDYWAEDDQGEYEESVDLEFTPEGLALHSTLIPWEEIDRMRGLIKENKK